MRGAGVGWGGGFAGAGAGAGAGGDTVGLGGDGAFGIVGMIFDEAFMAFCATCDA